MLNASRGALWFAVTLCTVNLSACNTVKGFGMQNLDQKIARKIDHKGSSDATSQEVRIEVDREVQVVALASIVPAKYSFGEYVGSAVAFACSASEVKNTE